ncbi:MAG: tyrosine-type recombinase/integrase [Candidatus Helarchaeota archaeon]
MNISVKDIIKSLSFEEKQKLLDSLRNDVQEVENLKSNAELIDEFVNSLKTENTKKTYKYALELFISFIKAKNLQYVTKIDLEKHYFDYLNNLNFRKQTKTLRFAVVVSFYKYFISLQEMDTYGTENQHFIENPISDRRRNWKEDLEPVKRNTLTNNEILEILKIMRQKKYSFRNYLMFYVLADTSMRINGIINIKIKNVDLDKRLIKTIDKGKIRKYAFGKNLKEEIMKWLKIRNCLITEQQNRFKYAHSEYLFFSRNDERIGTSYYSGKIFSRNLIKELTGKDVTPHDLRRSFKTNRTNLEQDWGQIEVLMNHLTGLDPKYLHPTDEMFLKWWMNMNNYDYKLKNFITYVYELKIILRLFFNIQKVFFELVLSYPKFFLDLELVGYPSHLLLFVKVD